MKRSPLYFALSGVDLGRYFFLIACLGGIKAQDASTLLVLRASAVPQLMFAAALFFLGMDDTAYAPYRPLLIMGKAVSFVALCAALAISGLLLSADMQERMLALALWLIALWDAAVALIAAFTHMKKKSASSLDKTAHADMPESAP